MTIGDPAAAASQTSDGSIVVYIFAWVGKRFLTTDQQEEIGILSAEMRARLAASYNALENAPAEAAAVEPATPGQTALFNQWEDAQECARCGGRMGADRLVLHVQGLRH